jgi:hypothetical protein
MDESFGRQFPVPVDLTGKGWRRVGETGGRQGVGLAFMCNRVEVQVEVQVECSNVRGCVGVRRVL